LHRFRLSLAKQKVFHTSSLKKEVDFSSLRVEGVANLEILRVSHNCSNH
jgi:hypothetical protein